MRRVNHIRLQTFNIDLKMRSLHPHLTEIVLGALTIYKWVRYWFLILLVPCNWCFRSSGHHINLTLKLWGIAAEQRWLIVVWGSLLRTEGSDGSIAVECFGARGVWRSCFVLQWFFLVSFIPINILDLDVFLRFHAVAIELKLRDRLLDLLVLVAIS